jgi:hypothetical protein
MDGLVRVEQHGNYHKTYSWNVTRIGWLRSQRCLRRLSGVFSPTEQSGGTEMEESRCVTIVYTKVVE